MIPVLAAVEALPKPLVLALAQIRFNTIHPGYSDRELWSALPGTRLDEVCARMRESFPAVAAQPPLRSDVFEAVRKVA